MREDGRTTPLRGSVPGELEAITAAYLCWPADIKARLSFHDLRRMAGWRPAFEPLTNDPAVAALCDSNFRAGALAGWNAALHSDAAEGERIMSSIRSIDPGSLQPILARTKARTALEAGSVGTPEGVNPNTGKPSSASEGVGE